MYIIDDGIKLNAKLERPANGAERCPLVIIIHGFTGYIEERHIVAVSDALLEIGFATLRVDMYGHGESEGTFRDHTLFKWMTNSMTIIDYARSLDFVTDIFLCGHSQGGLMVMLAAALKHDVIKGVIPMSPGTMIPEIVRGGEFLGQKFDPEHIPDEFLLKSDNINGGPQVLGGNYFRVAEMIDVDKAIAKYKGPVLIIHGDADEAVPVECGIDAANKYENAKLVLIPGDTHCYDYHLDMVVDAVKDWMKGFIE